VERSVAEWNLKRGRRGKRSVAELGGTERNLVKRSGTFRGGRLVGEHEEAERSVT
jgi:hypothetical protein